MSLAVDHPSPCPASAGGPAHAGVHFPPPLIYAAGLLGGWLINRWWPLPLMLDPPLAQVTLQNAIVLLFPAWVELGNSRARGFEASGQRILTLFGSAIALGITVLPALLAGGLLTFLLAGPFGATALVLGAAVAAAWIVAEVAVAIRMLGKVLDRLDPSTAGIEASDG